MKEEEKIEETEFSGDNEEEASEERTEYESEDEVPEEIETPFDGAGDEIGLLRLELDEYKNLYLRKAAEFENFKKRKQIEFKGLIQSAEESLISNLLPVLDDFDRFEANSSGDSEALIKGMQMIREKLWGALAARGVEVIESLGKPFDPLLHEAVMQQEVEGMEPDIVNQEHQRGYKLGEKVIRHSKVVVTA